MKLQHKLHLTTLTAIIAVCIIVAIVWISFKTTEGEKKSREHIDNASKILLGLQQMLDFVDSSWDDQNKEVFSKNLDNYLEEIKLFKETHIDDKILREIELLMKEILITTNQIKQIVFFNIYDKNEINKKISELFTLTGMFYNISRSKTSYIGNITIYGVLLIGFISVMIIAIISIFVSRDIVNPLLRLQYGAQIIGEGNLQFRINSERNDEIGQLSRFFDEMASHLESTMLSLKEAETKYKNLVETISDWIYETDDKGNFTYVSPKIKDMLGYEPQEVIGKTIFDFMMVEDDTFQMKGFYSFIKKGSPFSNWVVPLVNKQGDIVHIESNGTPVFDEKGQFKGFRGVNRNISKRMALQKEKDKLIEELEKALSRVKLLNGLLPICSGCKKIRDDTGYWKQIETYISEHSEAEFSHSICPECAQKLYPEYYKKSNSS
ncbi:MAG: PAS domain S-box protein [Thermodesulfovibrionales bacterium]|nr:PAS domain S-box protein [Thermodesulfovibrionales bacterium]